MTHSELFAQAKKYIPGGVNSPVRAFGAVGGTPIFMDRAEGAHLYDVNQKRYVDYIGSWGPMILGHSHPDIVHAICQQAKKATSFGAPTVLETQLAELICELMPHIESLRFVNSGTEATMSAIRLARGYTGRELIIKFEGCYHGHSDSLLVKAGSGALTFGAPSSPGVLKSTVEQTLVLSFNDVEQLEEAFRNYGGKIAGVIIEPFPGNMNLLRPTDLFMKTLRKLCTEYGAVLIFDEVMTGFRVALGGAQALLDIHPDLTTLGKVIGGGLPVGAFGGRKEILSLLSPEGPIYQAGTLSGNPIAMAAGLAQLKHCKNPGFYTTLSEKTKRLIQGLQKKAQEHHFPFSADSVGGMFGMYFSENVPTCFKNVTSSRLDQFNRFFHHMLEAGFYFAPSAYEAGFVSLAHTSGDIDATIEAAGQFFEKEVKQI
jgi:glutamate-1-semialdehyde 2,1-aminomutase